MPENASADVATWMLLLSGVVISFLIGVGLLQLLRTGDLGQYPEATALDDLVRPSRGGDPPEDSLRSEVEHRYAR